MLTSDGSRAGLGGPGAYDLFSGMKNAHNRKSIRECFLGEVNIRCVVQL